MIGKDSEKLFVQKYLCREISIAIRFGIVGIAATITHILIVSLLLSKALLPPLIANALAFLMAFGVSFTGHYFWTFESPGAPGKAVGRFFLISVSAFSFNTIILAGLLRAGWLTPLHSAIFAAIIVPLITFSASRFWGFKNNLRSN